MLDMNIRFALVSISAMREAGSWEYRLPLRSIAH